jgi:hypothetical protein
VTTVNVSERCEVSGGVKKEKDTVKASVKKKRVLKQKDDNPLLRPIGREVKYLKREISKSEPETLGKEFWANRVQEKKRVPKKTSQVSVSQGLTKDASTDTATSELFKERQKSEETSKKRVESKTPKHSTFVEHSTVADSEDEENEEEDFAHGLDDDDELSDFVVDDSEILEDVESLIDMPPPRSIRRLVRGRAAVEDDDDDLELRMKKLNVEADDSDAPCAELGEGLPNPSQGNHSEEENQHRRRKSSEPSKSRSQIPEPRKKMFEQSSDIDDPFILRL